MKRRYLVSGEVQGVGFRYFTLRQARRLGLSGWVRNLADGRVEAVAQGPAALLARFEEELRRGPGMSAVAGVGAEDLPEQGEDFHTFEIR